MGEMSQRQAADAIGVSESRVSRWLHGGLPSDKTLELAATWLEIEPDDLAAFLRKQRTAGHDTRSTRDRIAEMEGEMAELRRLVERLQNSLDRPVDGEARGRRVRS